MKGWTLADRIDDADYAVLLREALVRMQPFRREGSRVEFPAPAHIASARKS